MNQVQCPACKIAFQYAADSAGRRVHCPGCQTTLQLPGASTSLPAPVQPSPTAPSSNQPVSAPQHSDAPTPNVTSQPPAMSHSAPRRSSTPTTKPVASKSQRKHGFRKKGKPWLGTIMVWGGMGTGIAAIIVVIVFFINGGENVDTSASVKKENNDSTLSKTRESRKKSDEGFEKLRTGGQKSHREAMAIFTDALSIDSRNADAYVGLGHARKQANTNSKPDEILALRIDDYSNAIKIDREKAEAYGGRAECFFEQKNFDLALSDIINAIKFGTGHRFYNDWTNLKTQIEIEQRVSPNRFDADKIFK